MDTDSLSLERGSVPCFTKKIQGKWGVYIKRAKHVAVLVLLVEVKPTISH